jgi:hypothetical protein
MHIGNTVKTRYGLGIIKSKGYNLKFQRNFYYVEFDNNDRTKPNKRKEIIKFWEYEIKLYRGENK